jgi:hypothetical protein
VVKENSVASHMTNNELFFTNHDVPQYSDFVLKLLGNGKSVCWHQDDKDDFFQCLLQFIEAQVIEDIHQKSPFFRLYKAYQDNNEKQDSDRRFRGFYSWVGGLNAIYLAGEINNHSLTSHFVNDVLFVVTDFDYEDVCNGYIYLCDLIAVQDSILRFCPIVHEKLITKGVLFNCRGHEYGQLAGNLDGDRTLLRFGSDLRTCWHIRQQYSSFVRCTVYEPTVQGQVHRHQMSDTGVYLGKKPTAGDKRKWTSSQLPTVDENNMEIPSANKELNMLRVFDSVVKFGQLNSCWRTDMPGDTIVHGLAFANVTFRETTYNAKRRHYYIGSRNMGEKFDRHIPKFVSVNYIDSTSIGVSAISFETRKTTNTNTKNVWSPMLKPTGAQSFIQYTDASKQSSGAYAMKDSLISELYLIELHPERISFKYDKISTDIDGTKLWEHS